MLCSSFLRLNLGVEQLLPLLSLTPPSPLVVAAAAAIEVCHARRVPLIASNPNDQPALQKTRFSLNFFLCLSRACLGKLIVFLCKFNLKWLPKRRFPHLITQ